MIKRFSTPRMLGASMVFCLGATLAACGGGGGDSGGSGVITPPGGGGGGTSAPTAVAGEDKSAASGTNVGLSGTGVDDGSIVAYEWRQVANGSPTVVLQNANTRNPSFTLPELFAPLEFLFELTVTDNDNEIDTDEVTVTGRPLAGLVVGTVTGNTRAKNSVAAFSVRLANQPLETVTIPVSSSSTEDGDVEQSQLVFTPQNWNVDQYVRVVGARDGDSLSGNGFNVVLGGASSLDSFYDGFNPEDVHIPDVTLEIEAPTELIGLVPGLLNRFDVDLFYNGDGSLTYSLIDAPEGMTIDLNTGEISWIPGSLDENLLFDVEIGVNDGEKFDSISFEIYVNSPVPVATQQQGENTLTVGDATTNLNGMALKLGTGVQSKSAGASLSDLHLERVDMQYLEAVPEQITPISDVLFVREPFERELTIDYPVNLPAGYKVRDVALYSFAETTESNKPIWTSAGVVTGYSGTASVPVISIDVTRLSGMYFFGVTRLNFTEISSNEPAEQTLKAASASTVDCQPSDAAPDDESAEDRYRTQVCTDSTKPGFQATVTNFGTSADATRWGNVKIEEMFSWLVASSEQFEALNMSFDQDFKVNLFDEAPRNGGMTLGYVSSAQNFSVLNLNVNSRVVREQAQATAAHEFFHHAQARTKIAGKDSLIKQYGSNLWLIEGTAVWFEDVVFDSLNAYASRVGNSLYLEKGLHTIPRGASVLEPYRRFSFFKLLSSRCSNLGAVMPRMMNVDAETDRSGIANLNSLLVDANCDFGHHFGAELANTLTAAMTYYSYASILKNDIRLIDANESGFNFAGSGHRFSPSFPSTTTQALAPEAPAEYVLRGPSSVPAAGAFSFKVDAISGTLPEGAVAELVIESSREVVVSLASDSAEFVGNSTIGSSTHQWFSTFNQSSYTYEANNTVPELFVTIVNPSVENGADVSVSFRVRNKLDADTIISSHTSGDVVSNRVVSIAGNIPPEAIEDTDNVVVTANGISSTVVMNEDGSFAADVVVFLGDNIIKAQGFKGSAPATNEEVISITGEASSGFGVNALVSSGTVFVLRWNTNGSDVDIYSTDKNGTTIWYSNKTVSGGNLDVDDTSGFGPEVVSYQAGNDILVNGQFDVDVHYYSGSPVTDYTLDVILNETQQSNRRAYRFSSTSPLATSNPGENGPGDSGNSRYNNVLGVRCSGQSLCSLSNVDTSKLSANGSNEGAQQTSTASVQAKSSKTSSEPEGYERAKDACEADLANANEKGSYANWYCEDNGRKVWF